MGRRAGGRVSKALRVFLELSHNLNVMTFLCGQAGGRVSKALTVFLELSHNLNVMTFLWSAGRVHFRMSSLLGLPNSIHIIPFVALVHDFFR